MVVLHEMYNTDVCWLRHSVLQSHSIGSYHKLYMAAVEPLILTSPS